MRFRNLRYNGANFAGCVAFIPIRTGADLAQKFDTMESMSITKK